MSSYDRNEKGVGDELARWPGMNRETPRRCSRKRCTHHELLLMAMRRDPNAVLEKFYPSSPGGARPRTLPTSKPKVQCVPRSVSRPDKHLGFGSITSASGT